MSARCPVCDRPRLAPIVGTIRTNGGPWPHSEIPSDAGCMHCGSSDPRPTLLSGAGTRGYPYHAECDRKWRSERQAAVVAAQDSGMCTADAFGHGWRCHDGATICDEFRVDWRARALAAEVELQQMKEGKS